MARLLFGSQINQAEFVDTVERLYGEVDGMEVRMDDIVLTADGEHFEELKELAMQEGGSVEDWT